MPRHQASLTLDSELFDELDRIAEEEDESRSEVVNELLWDSVVRRQQAETVEAAAHAGVGTAALVVLVAVSNLAGLPVAW